MPVSTGPTTAAGKAISSRNATTHGLFARDVVLPALGEGPQAYCQLQAEWTRQINPRTLSERHCVERIAAASWRLRRLHHWQVQLFEDDSLTEDERINRLDKALRHETALHRQIDAAVKMLARHTPPLDQARQPSAEAARELPEAPQEIAMPEFSKKCENELLSAEVTMRLEPNLALDQDLAREPDLAEEQLAANNTEICKNELRQNSLCFDRVLFLSQRSVAHFSTNSPAPHRKRIPELTREAALGFNTSAIRYTLLPRLLQGEP